MTEETKQPEEEPKQPSKIKFVTDAWLVLLLALCFGAGLTGVQVALSAKIEANKLKETVGQIPALVPGAASGEKIQVGDRMVYRALDEDGDQVGWVVPAAGQGFADVIELIKNRIESIFKVEETRIENIRLDEFLTDILRQELPSNNRDYPEINTQIEKGLSISMDRGVLKKVLVGLLKNAIENTPD